MDLRRLLRPLEKSPEVWSSEYTGLFSIFPGRTSGKISGGRRNRRKSIGKISPEKSPEVRCMPMRPVFSGGRKKFPAAESPLGKIFFPKKKFFFCSLAHLPSIFASLVRTQVWFRTTVRSRYCASLVRTQVWFRTTVRSRYCASLVRTKVWFRPTVILCITGPSAPESGSAQL